MSTSDKSTDHPLLGTRVVELAGRPYEHYWQNLLDATRLAYLLDHQVLGSVVVPGVVYVEMALSAAIQIFGTRSLALETIEYKNVLVLADTAPRVVQMSLCGDGSAISVFRVHSRSVSDTSEAWLLHAVLSVRLAPEMSAGTNAPHASAENLRTRRAIETTVGSLEPNPQAFMVPAAQTVKRVKSTRHLAFSLMFFSSGEAASGIDKYRTLFDSVRFGDQNEFANVWLPERHFTPFGCLFPNPSLLLAAVARETTRIRLCAGSIVVPLHHPLRVAEELSVVDNLSGGRVSMSCASGWNAGDFAFFPERYADRHEEMYRGLEVIQRLWRGDTIEVTSGDGTRQHVRSYPSPIQSVLPIWITSTGTLKTFERAGAIGANVLTHLVDHDIDALSKKITGYRKARIAGGHDPETGVVTVMLHTFLGDDIERVKKQVQPYFCDYLRSNTDLLKVGAASRARNADVTRLSSRDLDEIANIQFEKIFSKRALLGTPESCLGLVEQLQDAGVDEIASLIDFVSDTNLVRSGLEHLNTLRAYIQTKDRLRTNSSPSTVSSRTTHVVPQTNLPETSVITEVQACASEDMAGADFYKRLRAAGGNYGSSFQSIAHLWRNESQAIAKFNIPDSVRVEMHQYEAHPAVLDNCFVVLMSTILGKTRPNDTYSLGLPSGMRSFRIVRNLADAAWSHAVRTTPAQNDFLEGDVRVLDIHGNVMAEALGLRIQLMPRAGNVINEGNQSDPEDGGLHQVEWRETSSLPAPPAVVSRGPWLILADENDLGKTLAARLRERNEDCVVAFKGPRFERHERNRLSVNPASADDFVRLLREAFPSDGASPRGVVHLWLNKDQQAYDAEALVNDSAVEGASIAALARGMAASNWKHLRLWIVTAGAQSVARDDGVNVAQSMGWGIGGVLFNEHPTLRGALIDLDPHASVEESVTQTIGVLDSSPTDRFIAFRQGRAYVKRVTKHEPYRPPLMSCRVEGSYLITGGLGDLGRLAAQTLVKRGARHVILLQRRELPPRDSWGSIAPASAFYSSVKAILTMEKAGVRVHVVSANVAHETELAAALESAQRAGAPPIRGVVHTAGVLDDRTIANLDFHSFQRVLTPKIGGAWALHRALRDVPLDFFVMFSSVASVLGPPGQGSYAAGNAFLDALAFHRHAQGAPALSIIWGPWANTAMVVQLKQNGYLADGVVEMIPVHRGASVLERLLSYERPQVIVMPVDWEKLGVSYPELAHDSLFSEVIVRRHKATHQLFRNTGNSSTKSHTRPLRELILGAAGTDPHANVAHELREKVAQIIRLPSSEIEIDRSLADVGFDSLSAIEMRNWIEAELDIALPMASFLGSPSIDTLATVLLEQAALFKLSTTTANTAGDVEEIEI